MRRRVGLHLISRYRDIRCNKRGGDGLAGEYLPTYLPGITNRLFRPFECSVRPLPRFSSLLTVTNLKAT